jgi:repressor LexA
MALTRRQREILDYIADFIRTRRYSPSLEEIAEHFGLSSVATVHKHVSNLEKKAFIRRSWNRSRSIDLITTELDSASAHGVAEPPIPFRPRAAHGLAAAHLPGAAEALAAGTGDAVLDPAERAAVERLPLLGRVAAGRPIEVVADQDEIAVPSMLAGKGKTFVLQVTGTSMIGEHIQDGDYVIVERRERATDGEKVVALLEDGEVTLKTYYRDPDGTVRLEPANPDFATIRVRDGHLRIQGVVIGVMRKYRH